MPGSPVNRSYYVNEDACIRTQNWECKEFVELYQLCDMTKKTLLEIYNLISK